MKNESKTQVNEEMRYFFGFPRGSYSEALEGLERTRVNSCQTSSITLADFWRPENLEKVRGLFAPHLPGFDPASALKFFEFPTEALHDGKPIGSPSMTDIMVIAPGIQMAIEGKFTEYVEFTDQTVREWFAVKLAQADETWSHASRERYLRKILRAWFGHIRKAGCTGLADDAFFAECMDISYQFLHRAASACCKADIGNGAVPVLTYQLFFDAKDAHHIEKMEQFKADLRHWAETLKLRNMKCLIVSVPVTNAADVERRFRGVRGRIFEHLRFEMVYKFDFNGMTVESII